MRWLRSRGRRAPSACNASVVRHDEASRAVTTLFEPEATRQSPLRRNRPGVLRRRERYIAVFPGWLISSQSLPGCAFFERETVALKGEAFPPKGDRQGFQRTRH